jgi:peptidoglycan-associated lipoprotein
MTTPRNHLVAFVIIATVTLGTLGCQNKAKPKTVPETPTAPAETARPQQPETPPQVAEPFPGSGVDKTNVVEPTVDEWNRQRVLQTIYFGYNSDEIDDASKATLQANAAWIKGHGRHTVEVGGHCDERGSIGYNVALGDRRAKAVKDYLVGLGVGAGQLVSVSFGEEKPADPGHTDAAWAKNRRAEFTIQP